MAARKLKGIAPDKICQKVQQLRGDRGNYENVWQDIGDYIIPRKSDITNTSYPGEPKYNRILDSTGMTSLDLLTGALHSMMTNPSGYFFNMTTGNPDLDANDNVRIWLQDVVRKMHYRLNNSNFQTEVQEYYVDLAGFGTAAMSIEEDNETVLRFNTRPLKEIFVEENSKGYIDCLYRRYELDVRGMVDDFGYDNLPEKVRKDYDAGKAKKYEIIHAVYPARKVKGEKTYDPIFRYISQYILVCDKVQLDIKGFREFPFVVSRWSKIAGEIYGRGLGEKALPECKCVNKMTETTLRGAQKVVDPPLQAPDDGFVLPLITVPAGLNYYRAGSEDRIEPIFNDSRIDFGFQSIQMKQASIREAFFIDQLKLREGPQMTATEVTERTEQALRFLGPMLGRQQSEFLQPLIDRVYNIMDRRDEFDAPPAELEGVPLKVQYSSVMAMAQRLSELQSIQRTMGAIAPFASADPSVLDNIDGDKALHNIAKLLNFPQEILRKKEDVAKMRQQRAQQQQEQQEAMLAKERADAAQKAATAGQKATANGA